MDNGHPLTTEPNALKAMIRPPTTFVRMVTAATGKVHAVYFYAPNYIGMCLFPFGVCLVCPCFVFQLVLFCFLVGFGLVWFGLVCAVLFCVMLCCVWFGLVWFDMVWFGLVWFVGRDHHPVADDFLYAWSPRPPELCLLWYVLVSPVLTYFIVVLCCVVLFYSCSLVCSLCCFACVVVAAVVFVVVWAAGRSYAIPGIKGGC